MAVPAGDVRGVKASHGLGLDHEVLDALVESVAEVDGPVGVGRTVVEDILWGARAGGTDLGIQVLLLPRGKAFRLVVRQIGLHGEGSLGTINVDFSGLGAGSKVFSPPPMGKFSVDFGGLGAGSKVFSPPAIGRCCVDFSALGSGFVWGASGIRSS